MRRFIGLMVATVGSILLVNGSGIALAGQAEVTREAQAGADAVDESSSHGLTGAELLRAESALKNNIEFTRAVGARLDRSLPNGTDADGSGDIDGTASRSWRMKGVVLEDAKPYYVLGERRGVAVVARLGSPISSAGPWIRVDDEHLMEQTGLDTAEIQRIERSALSHDERDEMLASLGPKEVTFDDFVTERYTEQWDAIERIQLYIDTSTGELFGMQPYVAPPLPPHQAGRPRDHGATDE